MTTTPRNEAAERLILQWLRALPDETRDLARDDVHLAMRTERRATVERIRVKVARSSVFADIPAVMAILDEEAARV